MCTFGFLLFLLMPCPKKPKRAQNESVCQLKWKETVTQQVYFLPLLSLSRSVCVALPLSLFRTSRGKGMFRIDGWEWDFYVDYGSNRISKIMKSFRLRDQFHNNTHFYAQCPVQSLCGYMHPITRVLQNGVHVCVFYVEHVQPGIVFPVPATRPGSVQCLRLS